MHVFKLPSQLLRRKPGTLSVYITYQRRACRTLQLVSQREVIVWENIINNFCFATVLNYSWVTWTTWERLPGRGTSFHMFWYTKLKLSRPMGSQTHDKWLLLGRLWLRTTLFLQAFNFEWYATVLVPFSIIRLI